MILQREENKGVELTGYICKSSGASERGRREVSGEKSKPAPFEKANAKGMRHPTQKPAPPAHVTDCPSADQLPITGA